VADPRAWGPDRISPASRMAGVHGGGRPAERFTLLAPGAELPARGGDGDRPHARRFCRGTAWVAAPGGAPHSGKAGWDDSPWKWCSQATRTERFFRRQL